MNKELIELISRENFPIEDPKYIHNGIGVPRVTEIISKMIHEDYLLFWANSLGFKHQGYKKTVENAASIGSYSHDLIHNFLIGNIFDSNDIPYLGFRKWWSDITTNNTIEILGTEEVITCEYFGGTYDLLLKINDKIYLVDFKTSNHVSYKYFLQLSAYGYILKQKGINVDGFIILQLNKEVIQYTEYPILLDIVEHMDFMNKALQSFLSLVYGYYNITETESMYKSIFNRRNK